MSDQNRRHFMKTTAAAASAFAASSMIQQPARAAGGTAVDRVELGNTGIKVSRLAMGTGIHGGARVSDHTRMGEPAFKKLMHHIYDQGVNFLDMADLYGTHQFMKNAIRDKSISRDDYVILSKIWPRVESWNQASGGAIEEVNRFKKELDVDMLDIVLIHCMTDANWAKDHERIRDELSELKQKGEIRAHGVSCHDLGALKVAAELPWVDVILARINNKGAKMDGTPEVISDVLRTAKKNGKSIIGMKLYGEGTIRTPEEKDASVKYVLDNNLVDAMTIGMLKETEVDDTIERINRTLKA